MASASTPAEAAGDPARADAAGVDSLSERALSAARTAERVAALARIELDTLTQPRPALAVCAAMLALLGGAIGAAHGLGWLPLDRSWPAAATVVAMAGGSAICLLGQSILSGRRHTASLAVASDLAVARQGSVVARRVDTVLAGIYGRGGPAPADRQMIAALLRLVERDIEALAQRSSPAAAPAGPARRHERIVPRQTRTTVYTDDGRTLAARIIDLSLSGVAIETDLSGVPVGAEVRVGQQPARAVRKLQRGLAFEFKTPLPGVRVDPDVVL